jgi:hypothetical protein
MRHGCSRIGVWGRLLEAGMTGLSLALRFTRFFIAGLIRNPCLPDRA